MVIEIRNVREMPQGPILNRSRGLVQCMHDTVLYHRSLCCGCGHHHTVSQHSGFRFRPRRAVSIEFIADVKSHRVNWL